MKTQITIGADLRNIGTLILFFICFLFSLNSHSQKPTAEIGEMWENGTWKDAGRTLITYDGNGYLTQRLTQYLDASWKDQFRIDYTYNPDGTVNQMIISQLFIFLSKTRTTYTYNAAKKVLTEISEVGGNPLWTLSSKEINTYDGNNYLTQTLTQRYDNFTLTWKDNTQTTYTNNPDGTASQSVLQTWNGNVWENKERITYTYNNSKEITELSEKWNGTIWENDSLETNDYNPNGNPIQTLEQKWESGSWKNVSKYIITYNANGTQNQIVSQEWEVTSLTWKNSYRLTYNYGTLGVDEPILEKNFYAYPNPAQDKITIKADSDNVGLKYLVTDQLGRQFSSGTITDLETVIDVNQLASGIYFIQMGQNRNETIKVVKK